MAKVKYDGVVEAVHYRPDGQVEWVRTYLRRGPTFSDYILLDREALIEHLNSGKKYYSGRRIPLLASTFEISSQVKLIKKNGSEILVTDDLESDQDCLKNVPVM
jgi:hypothetical protein